MEFVRTALKCLFSWRFPPANDAELASADAIVTQSYNRHKDGTMGPGNAIMASVAKQLHELYGLPVIPQEELVMADPTLPYFDVAGGSKDGMSTKNWNTYEVAKFQANVCKTNGWRKVVVVVVPLGSGRALWCYKKLGLEPILAPMPSGGYYHPDNQTFTLRGPIRLFIREVLCRILFLKWGYLKT